MAVIGYFTKGHGEEGFGLLFCALKDIFLNAFASCETGKDYAAFGIIDPSKNEG